VPLDRPERRRLAAGRRRRRAFLRFGTVAVGLAAVALVAIALTSHTTPTKSRAGSGTHRTPRVVLHPPSPIPGYLLIADRGNNRMLLVDSAHHIYWRYPGGHRLAMPFTFGDDTFFGPRRDRIVSNQEDQQTIQIISFPGKRVLWRYGHVNVKSGRPGYLNTPDDAYLLPGGRVSVADAYNCRVIFISAAHRIVRQYGTTGVCRHAPPRYLGAVNGATPLPDGGTLVSEIAGSWVDDFSASGKLRWSVQAPVTYPSDPQLLGPNRILLADYASPGHAIIMTRTGHVLWRYGPASGPGALNHPSLATLIAPGLVAINDDFRQRVVIVSVRTHKIVWQYGHTDQAGTGPGYLNTPDGLDLLHTKDAQASPVVLRLLAPRVRQTVRPSAPGALSVKLPYRLPAPVEREVAVSHNGAVIIAGGLNAGSQSTNGVFRLSPSTGVLRSLGTVPEAFHDAAGAILGNGLFVFGGGAAHSSATVQRFDLGSHTGRVVGTLPRPLSDIASASTSNGTYLVGGYDDHVPRAEIYRTTDGSHFALVARLPVGLRYPAVAAVGTSVVIAGGTSASGPSDRVYVLDTSNGKLSLLGRLPSPVAHAQAATLGQSVYVAGGIGTSGMVSGSVVKIEPGSGRIVRVGGAVPVSDAATVELAGSALVIGGANGAGPTAAIRRLRVG
jgi:hypothetical protein